MRRPALPLTGDAGGGLLLLIAAVAALVWANSPWSAGYHRMADHVVGPSLLHLDLSVSQWAADGLLALFFFAVGVELKREFVVGTLRDPARAAIPVLAALGGMVVPAALYLGINVAAGSTHTLAGWAVPTATDIAFAVAVLAVMGTHLPGALRTFLLTLAVVDDLLAIVVIAVFYTDRLAPVPLLAAVIPIGLFGLAVQRGVRNGWILVPLALVAWHLVHASGVHATIAGVLLGFTIPARGPHAATEQIERRVRPLWAGFAVPVFAFVTAGVTVGGLSGLSESLTRPVTLGVLAGLVLGKPIGVFGTSYLLARFTPARLDNGLGWRNLWGLALLTGIGFTVSLLIGELAFDLNGTEGTHVKVGVLVASALSAALAAMVLRGRTRAERD